MLKIIYISGGQRSGKSEFAERFALELSSNPLYIATSRVWDKEHWKRIEQHQQRRDERWETIEEENEISKVRLEGRTALLDCVTLWVTNFFDDAGYVATIAYDGLVQEWDKFIKDQEGQLIVVSNELGMGMHPIEKGARDFGDLHGKVNQYIAARADEAYFVVSGLPLKVK